MKHFNRFVRKQYAVQLLSTPKAGLSDFFQSLSSNLSPACLQAYFPSLLLLFLAFSLPAPFLSQLLTGVSQRQKAGVWVESTVISVHAHILNEHEKNSLITQAQPKQ